MDIHDKPIQQRIDWLFERARDYSTRFCSPENWLARERYLARHPTAIAVLKCMDGRINIPVATNTPLGIIQPFRNLGGMFVAVVPVSITTRLQRWRIPAASRRRSSPSSVLVTTPSIHCYAVSKPTRMPCCCTAKMVPFWICPFWQRAMKKP
jgi:hypothetical protein